MSISDISCVQRDHIYKEKLVVAQELIKLSNEFYTALRTIAELDAQKANQLKILKKFSTLFYEENSVYKEYTAFWSETLETEINSLEQQAKSLNSGNNFTNDMNRMFEQLCVR